MNPKQKGVRAGYHSGQWREVPTGCPYELRTDMRRDWLDGWQLGLKLRERHREELLGMIVAVEGGK